MSDPGAPRAPDYILRMAHEDVWTTVGAAWNSTNGINLTINQGCSLSWKDLHVEGCRLILIPNTRGEKK